jgi:hypothetical protein
MTPQAPARRTAVIQKTKPTRRILPGDLICGQCGEGNAPTRKFCSRCGTSLETAVVAKTKWWKKFIPHRRRKELAAGERPWGSPTDPGGSKRRRGLPSVAKLIRPIMQLVTIAVLILGLVYGVSSSFRNSVNKRITSAKNTLVSKVKPKYLQVRPTSAKASTQDPANPGSNAVDGFTNTFWIAQPTDGQPILRVTFDQPVSIDKIIVHNGRPDNYQSTSRPEQLHLIFSDGKSSDVTLKDDPGAHTYGVKSDGKITSIDIHVLQLYKSFTPTPTGIALAEIEFFQRKK